MSNQIDESKSVAPVDGGVEKGTVADTRRSQIPSLMQLWNPDSTYRPLDPETIRSLSKLAQDQEAELAMAVQQISEKNATFRTRFGELAPDVSAVPELWKRYREAETSLQVAQAQVAYFGDVAQVALHDLLQIVDLVDETVRAPASRNTQVHSDFSAVLKISDQRGQAIRDGRARARAERNAVATAMAATGAGPSSTGA